MNKRTEYCSAAMIDVIHFIHQWVSFCIIKRSTVVLLILSIFLVTVLRPTSTLFQVLMNPQPVSRGGDSEHCTKRNMTTNQMYFMPYQFYIGIIC